MPLTTAQKATLKTHIQATSDLNAKYVDGDLDGLAALLNTLASPNFTVWKTNVPVPSVGQTLVASELAGLTALNNDRLVSFALYNPDGFNPSRSDHRAFFDNVFSGSGGAGTRAALLVLWKRLARRAEKLFATGTGSDASPATLTFEGEVDPSELVNL